MLACLCFGLSQLGKIARSADGSDRLVAFFGDRLGCDKQRSVEAFGHDLNRHASAFLYSLLYKAGVALARSEDVAAATAKHEVRPSVFHRRPCAIDADELPCIVKDKDAVRHSVEGRLPFLLRASGHLEQFGLRDACGELRGDRFDQPRFVISPMPHAIRLVYAERAAKATIDNQGAENLRAQANLG